MAAITAAEVKALRNETGLPMMECKSALIEADGDPEQAKEILQRKYKGKMETRAARETGEGRIATFISEDRKQGAIIDVRCETAPVAKTDKFVEMANTIAASVAAQSEMNPTAEQAADFKSVSHEGKTLQDEITDVFGLTRENIKLERVRKLAGEYVCGYVHHDGKTGVLLALDAVPKSESVGIDLCHHVTFANPLAIHREQIPAEDVEKVRKLAADVAVSEGKPAQIIEKIVTGKVNAFCAENALMDQEHVKFSKTKVRDVLREGGVNDVLDLAYFRIGG
jgi:elongation factor Ts